MSWGLDIFHQDVPDGDDVADASRQDKEVEHRVHVFFLVDAVEHGSCDIANAFCDNPPDGGCRYRVDEGLESNEHRQSHAHEAERLQIAVVFESGKAHHRASDGASPDKDKETPAPIALVSQGYQGDRRVGAGDMPVDGGMVPFPQSLLPLAPSR